MTQFRQEVGSVAALTQPVTRATGIAPSPGKPASPSVAGVRPCPHCGGRQMRRFGYYRTADGVRRQRFVCRGCGRTSSHATGTPEFRLKKRGAWQQMPRFMAESWPLRRVAAALGVHVSTAFRWRHRILRALCESRTPLEGVVSVTYVFVPYSEKGSRTGVGPGSRGARTPLRDALKGRVRPKFRRFVDGRPTCVLLGRSHSGQAAVVLWSERTIRVSPAAMAEGLSQLVSPGAEVYSFQPDPYAEACSRLGLRHRCAVQPAVAAGPRADAVPLPRTPFAWLTCFRGIATKYLDHYMAWFSALVSGHWRKGRHREAGGPL